jgi:hypothetical protein
MSRNVVRTIIIWSLALLNSSAFAVDLSKEEWVNLFNGKNLDGWYTFLASSGRNNDPKRIFKVERGMIHILDQPPTEESQEYGYLGTEREFSNCHIRAEFKWGEKRFAPRAQDKRDSGLLYYVVGPDVIWPRSLQLQIQETDVGDLWLNGGATVMTSLESEYPPTYGDGLVQRHVEGGRIATSSDFEDRNGWNTLEVILDGDRIVHLVNGRIVLRAWNLRQPDPSNPMKTIVLDRGRVLLEAEGAEIWFRKVQMKPLSSSKTSISANTAY